MDLKTWRVMLPTAAVLAAVSAVALAALPAEAVMSIHRTALNTFIQPGVMVWWLLLAGPYQFAPASLAGYAMIVAANTTCWCLALALAAALARGAVTRVWYLVAGPLLVLASLAILVLRASNAMVPSIVLDPLARFVVPGVTAWWLTLGALFQTYPSSPIGVVFAGLCNALFWFGAFRLLVAGVAFLRRKLGRPKPALG